MARSSAKHQRRPREKRALIACTRCRKLKKKCRKRGHGQCHRCSASGQVCRYVPVSDDMSSSRFLNSQSPEPDVFVQQVFPPTERSNIESSSSAMVEEDMEERQRADDAQSSSPPLTHGITYNPNVLSDMYSNNMSSTPNTDAHSTEPSSSPRYSVRQHDRLTTGHPQLRRRQPVSHATMLMPDVQAQPPFPFTPTADHQDGQGIADPNQSPPNLRMPSPPYQSNTNDTNASGPSNLQFENSVPYSDTSALRMATEYREYGGYHHLCEFCSSGFCRLHSPEFRYRGPTTDDET